MAQELEVRVKAALYGGNFACLPGDPQPFVLPGELVMLASDAPVIVLEPAASRVEPHCPHFGVCGGCQYQHAAYPAQLEFKQQILRDIFTDFGLTDIPQLNVYQGPEWAYRNRIRLRVEPLGDDFELGYSERGANVFLPIRTCPIAAPLLWRAAEALLSSASDPLSRRWLCAISEVELFCLPDESKLQMQLFLRVPGPAHGDATAFSRFCERLRSVLPELHGAGAEPDPELSRRSRRAFSESAWGPQGLAYPVGGRTYWVNRGAFFQVNRFLVDRLVELVCDGQQGSLAWDLFAGVGLFTAALAETFERVVAVEGAEASAAALVIAGKGTKGRPKFTAIQSSTLDFLRAAEHQRDQPDLIVLDPPRAGLGLEGSAVLARIAAPKLVYVSCDPVTLARDLAILTRKDYRIQSVALVDLFPQTFHLETVVHLERRLV
jgi:23S rRNA (uracil1939-C5)-methyltransferase